jgi:hypothetical protein
MAPVLAPVETPKDTVTPKDVHPEQVVPEEVQPASRPTGPSPQVVLREDAPPGETPPEQVLAERE